MLKNGPSDQPRLAAVTILPLDKAFSLNRIENNHFGQGGK